MNYIDLIQLFFVFVGGNLVTYFLVNYLSECDYE